MTGRVGLALMVSVACGGSPTPSSAPDEAAGRWRPAPGPSELVALGYVDGSRPAPATGRGGGGGVWAIEQPAPGNNLYTSGHAPGAWLVDRHGEPLWSWQATAPDLFPGDRRATRPPAAFWRRVALLPDGGVVGVFEGLGIFRLDRDSRPVWAVANGAHHDVQLVGDAVWTLVRRDAKVAGVPGVVVEDALVELAVADGAERRRWALPERVRAAGLPVRRPERRGFEDDLLHTNSVHVLTEPWGAHPAGHVLLSFLAISALGVLDPETGALTWASTGPFRHQHDPLPRPDGALWVFDNEAGPSASRLIAWSPGAPEPAWTWPPASKGVAFWSATCGAISAPGPGHLLVTESDAGRAWEIDDEGRLRWGFVTPHRVTGPDGERVATLFEVTRVAWAP